MLQERIYADLQAAYEAGAKPGCYWLSADDLATLEAEGLTNFTVVELEAFNAPKIGPNPKIIIADFGQVPLIVRTA